MPDNFRRNDQENLVAMLEELSSRRARDPLLSYPLHEKQRKFTDSVLKMEKKENWFIAANRSGKSDAGAYVGAHLARFGPPEGVKPAIGTSGIEVRDRATSGWVSALDFPTSRDVIQPKYFNNGFAPPGQITAPFIPEHEDLIPGLGRFHMPQGNLGLCITTSEPVYQSP